MSNSNKFSPSVTGMSVKQRPDVILPQAKVKTIMKSSPEIDNIGIDALYVITKATELFIDHITSRSFKAAGTDTAKGLHYKHLSNIVEIEPNLEFLRDIIPKKLPLRIALTQISKQEESKMKELLEN